MENTNVPIKRSKVNSSKLVNILLKMKKDITKNYQLYLIVLLPVIYIVVFHYIPMYGAQVAFKDFRAVDGIWGSPWVGFKHFRRFFDSYQFLRVLRNTLEISLYSLIVGFPMPIILALALNNTSNVKFKKIVQMVTYSPFFISTVVMVGIIVLFLSPRLGVINSIIELFGGQPKMFMGEPKWFSSIYVWSNIWQRVGWGTIIYLAALSGVDPSLHEAAIVDGASKIQRVRHIDIPGIMPTMVILLILNVGQLMNVGFEKVLLMQNDLNLQRSEIIATYVYKVGFTGNLPNFSYAAAIGLFNSIINFILIVMVNQIAKKTSDISLF